MKHFKEKNYCVYLLILKLLKVFFYGCGLGLVCSNKNCLYQSIRNMFSVFPCLSGPLLCIWAKQPCVCVVFVMSPCVSEMEDSRDVIIQEQWGLLWWSLLQCSLKWDYYIIQTKLWVDLHITTGCEWFLACCYVVASFLIGCSFTF